MEERIKELDEEIRGQRKENGKKEKEMEMLEMVRMRDKGTNNYRFKQRLQGNEDEVKVGGIG